MLLIKPELEIALFCDLERMGDRLRTSFEKIGHFLRRLEIEFLGRKTHSLAILERLPRLDAEQDLMGLGILSMEIVAIIRGYKWEGRADAQSRESIDSRATGFQRRCFESR